MAIKYCNHAGCREFIGLDEQYCAKHKKESQLQRSRSHKDNDEFYQFYHSKKWTRTSKAYRNAYPICENCIRKRQAWEANPVGNPPLLDIATSVDHLVALKDGGEPLHWSNLQSLCATCHNKKTIQENKNRN